MPATEKNLTIPRTDRDSEEKARPLRDPVTILWTVNYTSTSAYTIITGEELVKDIVVPSGTLAEIVINAPAGFTFDPEKPIVWEQGRQPAELQMRPRSATQLELQDPNFPKEDTQVFTFLPIFSQDPRMNPQPVPGVDPTIFNEGFG